MLTDKMKISEVSFRYSCLCGRGKIRKNNEDNFYLNGEIMTDENQMIISSDPSSKNFINSEFFAVFDGMGGGDFGEIASMTCAEYTRGFFSNAGNIISSDVTPSLQDYCAGMNEAVFSKGEQLRTHMFGSTVAGVYLFNGQMWFVNVGDSRAYLVRDSKMMQVSTDHVDRDDYQMKKNYKPPLLQHMGMDPEEIRLEPSIARYEIASNDRILLCSDGLTDMVDAARIETIILGAADMGEATKTLYDAAMSSGGIDNITIILIELTEN